MSKKFLIAGSIVDTDADRFTFEDVTPAQVNAVLSKLESDEDIELEITSYGGSVSAGLAICNLLKKASAEGHKTTAHVIGIAASMASAIACACDEMKIDANAFLMIHNPWTMAMGNAIDLRKEAEVLDQYRDALLAIYRTKFDVADEVIKKMLDDETWIVGESAPMFALSCEVIPTQEPLKAAAFAKNMPEFIHTPKALKEIIMEKEEELKKQANTQEQPVEEKADETPAEPVVEEPKAEEETKVEDETKVETDTKVEDTPVEAEEQVEMIAKAEADKRVSGMQSTMAKQMDAMKKDYEAKISEYEVQMKAKDEELITVRAEITSLTQSLDETKKELSEMTSAFKEKADALDALNGSVNTPNETFDWKSLKGKAFFDWYAKTH